MTSARRPLLAQLLLLLLLLLPPGCRPAACPSVCLCLSDTVSCSAAGLTKLPLALPSFSVTLDLGHNRLTWLPPGGFARMPRLENLALAHNRLDALGEGAFRNASGLRRLDLSANRLLAVERHYFLGLWRLEELLLFGNRIAAVSGAALSGLSGLRTAYFSANRLADFPFASIRERSHPFLSMLDLSSNRMRRLPWEAVAALPGPVQRGLYLHNNSLLCDCAMYAVFRHWELRGYGAPRDFADQHTCTAPGNPRATIRFLRQARFFQNCSVEQPAAAAGAWGAPLPVTVLLPQVTVVAGQRVRLDCETALSGGGAALSFTWRTPGRGPLAAGAPPLSLFANGTLEIAAAEVNDSGSYVCTAADGERALNATREVSVTVLPPPPPPEAFNTGYTTLAGCVVTAVGVLVYLYMTPCRCGCCKQPRPPAGPASTFDPGDIAPALFSPAGARDRRETHAHKHVAFLEPASGEEGTDWPPES
ncbi:Amphoterin-induced protein 3 [Liparis tanakae]|uniref:Amphoterin-induced protein 3 n=1 Tax=Liparis tanakae TaxID=230148 RepID=A0A4Z2FHY4_9TELE|nr:Amphoterin-induced protein 3 [Liparis tanakae]